MPLSFHFVFLPQVPLQQTVHILHERGERFGELFLCLCACADVELQLWFGTAWADDDPAFVGEQPTQGVRLRQRHLANRSVGALTPAGKIVFRDDDFRASNRITSYNVCYTKLLRV